MIFILIAILLFCTLLNPTSPYTIASSCCANLSAGPTIVRIGIPRVTPPDMLFPVAPKEVAEGLALVLYVGVSSGLVEGKVNVEVEGLSVHLRWTSAKYPRDRQVPYDVIDSRGGGW